MGGQQQAGLPDERLFVALADRLQTRYPGRIQGKLRWIVTNASGGMGMLSLLYASLSEYLIFFGTPIGTEGYSGRYPADVYDFMLEGEMHYFFEGETQRNVRHAGEALHIPRPVTKGYRMAGPAWKLEYARGWIPLMLPFGFGTSLGNSMDFRSAWRQFRGYSLQSGCQSGANSRRARSITSSMPASCSVVR